MGEFISSKNVFVDQDEDSRIDVLKAISKNAEQLGITDDAEAVFQAFLWRENQCETGMEDGFAVPHAKSAAIKYASVIVFKTKKALEWPSFDGKPVDISIALLVPEAEAGTTHLKLLSKTAILLMEPDFREFVRNSNDAEAIAKRVDEGVSSIEDDEDED